MTPESALTTPCRLSECTGDTQLRDCTLNARFGVRGANARSWLTSQPITCPEQPNRIVNHDESSLVMALSHREFWVLDTERVAEPQMPESQALSPDTYPLFCQHSHAWLVLSGDARAQVMAKLCGVDLREAVFPLGHVAQTQMARINAVIAHHTLSAEAVFSLFVDVSLAQYAIETLEDAIWEFS